ncbi:NAD(P)/FAD-dependent oxidoreductase [Candidatus Woesearchaeota archaeon]|nr:NAD(P)/FAD-dependent oxidoreductase [Candidatus Woesearchaeota archaeon]
MAEKIVVLGGGASALGAAYELAKHNFNTTIIEKGKNIGGLASSYKIDGFYIERFYHHFFPTDELVFQLAKELGIKDKFIWRKTKMGFYYKNKLYGFTSPLDILRFKPLAFMDRIKFGLSMLKIAKNRDYGNLDKVSAEKWLIGVFGRDAYEKIFRPMLKIKFAMSIDNASAAFVYGRLHARAKSRSKSLVSEKLGYMEGGYNSLIKALYNRIRAKSEIIYNSDIVEIRYSKDRYIIKISKSNKIKIIEADYVINTLPLEIFSRIAKNFPGKLMHCIKKIKYQAVICATIGLKRRLSDYYWINVSSADLPFHGVIEHTNFIPSRNYKNFHIVYIFNYVSPEHEFWKVNESSIKKAYLSGLQKMFPHMNRKDILWFKLSKERYATPIFLQGYEENMKKIENARNLYFAGSFKIYPNSRNVNNVIRTGIDAAKDLLKENNL